MSMDRLKELHAVGWAVELPGSSAMKAINEFDAVVAERDAARKRVAELETKMRLIAMQDVDKLGQYTAFTRFAQEIARNSIGEVKP